MNVTVLIQGHDFDIVHHFPNIKYFMASFKGKSSKFSTAWRSADALFLLLKVCFEAFANESPFYWISIVSHFTSSVTASNFKFRLCFIIYSSYTAFLIFFFSFWGNSANLALTIRSVSCTRTMEVVHTLFWNYFSFFRESQIWTFPACYWLKENHMPSFS